ncbi:MAG TPA: YgjP-like metallopeptidase domain-containing protein [Alphaproteobacteria bacterium]|nr:YgjP-like metallopeptidase domain-containing protein [Alphaproteobacteria bacterium]
MPVLPYIFFRRPPRRRARRKRIVPALPAHRFADGATIVYLGHGYRLRVTQDAGLPQGCRLVPRRLTVNIHDKELSGKNLHAEVRLEILLWIKRRARVKFQRRVDLWAGRMGVACQRLIVSNPRSRWGSCNAGNVVRLNWRLMLAPLPLLDYVVAHELSHVAHKNHSKNFWDFLAAAMPDCRERRRRLRSLEREFIL